MKNFTALLIVVMVGFNACKPDSDQPCRAAILSPLSLKSDDAAKIPFAGKGDTLVYVNTAGDTIMCIGSEKTVWYKTFPVKNNPECPDDSIGYTISKFDYTDNLSKLSLTSTVYTYDTLLTISANSSVFSIHLKYIGKTDSTTWFDSLPFGNKMFYGLNTFVNSSGDSLYYNRNYGMVGLKQASQRFYITRFNSK